MTGGNGALFGGGGGTLAFIIVTVCHVDQIPSAFLHLRAYGLVSPGIIVKLGSPEVTTPERAPPFEKPLLSHAVALRLFHSNFVIPAVGVIVLVPEVTGVANPSVHTEINALASGAGVTGGGTTGGVVVGVVGGGGVTGGGGSTGGGGVTGGGINGGVVVGVVGGGGVTGGGGSTGGVVVGVVGGTSGGIVGGGRSGGGGSGGGGGSTGGSTGGGGKVGGSRSGGGGNSGGGGKSGGGTGGTYVKAKATLPYKSIKKAAHTVSAIEK
jgi:hypothetical protein